MPNCWGPGLEGLLLGEVQKGRKVGGGEMVGPYGNFEAHGQGQANREGGHIS